MQKKLITLAVAGALAAPAAFAATANVDVYGILSIAIEDTDVATKDIAVVDRVSRIGFKGSEDLGGGLSAIWQIETQLSATGADGVGGTQSWANRNTFVGLKSASLGTVLAGRHDTPYKLGTGKLDNFADTAGDYNLGGIKLTGSATNGGVATGGNLGYVNAQHDLRSPSAIAYISPTWSGVHFAVAGVATNTGIDSKDSIDAVSATVIYSQGPIFASLSYQKADNGKAALGVNDLWFDTDSSGGYTGASDNYHVVFGETKAWKLGLGYTFGNTTVNGIYEKIDVGCTVSVNGGGFAGCSDFELTNWMVNATHKMGNIALKAAYGNSDLDGFGDARSWTVGVDYSLSKRTTVYALVNDSEGDSIAATTDGLRIETNPLTGKNDVRTVALGLKHSF